MVVILGRRHRAPGVAAAPRGFKNDLLPQMTPQNDLLPQMTPQNEEEIPQMTPQNDLLPQMTPQNDLLPQMTPQNTRMHSSVTSALIGRFASLQPISVAWACLGASAAPLPLCHDLGRGPKKGALKGGVSLWVSLWVSLQW